jgi:ribosomal protein S18 acetylase RimI-like enzyme
VSDIVYRDATADDAGELAEFAARTFTETFGRLYPAEDLAAFLAEKYGEPIQRAEIDDADTRYHLALKNGRIVGYVMMGALDIDADEPGALELHRLYVDTWAKGAGIAQKLTDEVLNWARDKGAPALYLSVWENNGRAQRFYRRYGFEHVGEHKFMVGRVADRDFIWRLKL